MKAIKEVAKFAIVGTFLFLGHLIYKWFAAGVYVGEINTSQEDVTYILCIIGFLVAGRLAITILFVLLSAIGMLIRWAWSK